MQISKDNHRRKEIPVDDKRDKRNRISKKRIKEKKLHYDLTCSEFTFAIFDFI